MRIVHVFKDFYPPLAAGITCYIHDVADEAARRGHEVEIHVAGVRHSRREVLANGVVVHRHREWGRLLSSPLSPALAAGVRTTVGDVLHVHMPNPVGELGAWRSRGSVPMVASFHSRLGRQRFLEPMYGPLRRAVLRRASIVIVSSEPMARTFEVADFAGKVEILPYGVSPRLVPLASGHVHDDGLLRLLFVGRLVYYKGLDVLLRAIARTRGCTLTIVGVGPLRPELERLRLDLGLGDLVRFAGSVTDDELRGVYATHDVFVLPSNSRAESFGLAMVEAMTSGLPAISTEVGTGTGWVNIDGESGLVVPPGDVDALAAAIARLRSPELRAALGAGARSRAGELFSFERHCDRLFDIYAMAHQTLG